MQHPRHRQSLVRNHLSGLNTQNIPAQKVYAQGRQLAFLAGVMHRDISKGSILIVLETALLKGFICDLNCGSFVDKSAFGCSRPQDDMDALEHDLKERAGASWYFAIELLHRTADVFHCVHHDLESFYWVIL